MKYQRLIPLNIQVLFATFAALRDIIADVEGENYEFCVSRFGLRIRAAILAMALEMG